jgi:hypothetical protein
MGGAAAAVGTVANIAGGLIGGSKAADAAKGQAEALRAAADKASAMAQFNPYGMTTNFGTSTFEDGKGGYTLSPELQSIQDRLISQAGAYDPTQVAQAAQPLYGGASSLFQRGADYLGQSPEQVSAKYIADQQALLAPSREAGFNRVLSSNFARGTGGLGVQTGTGGAPANPLAQAYFNQVGQQDLQLAAQADQAAMDRTKFGAGLFGTGGTLLGQVPALTTAGYNPLQNQLALAGTTETMGQQPFLLSQNLANNYAQAGANAGKLYLAPQEQAANAYAQYQGYSPMAQYLQSAGQGAMAMSGMGGGGGGPATGSWFDNLLGNQSTASMYNTNPYSEQTRMLAAQNEGFL